MCKALFHTLIFVKNENFFVKIIDVYIIQLFKQKYLDIFKLNIMGAKYYYNRHFSLFKYIAAFIIIVFYKNI